MPVGDNLFRSRKTALLEPFPDFAFTQQKQYSLPR